MHAALPSASLVTMPGRISISCPFLSTPCNATQSQLTRAVTAQSHVQSVVILKFYKCNTRYGSSTELTARCMQNNTTEYMHALCNMAATLSVVQQSHCALLLKTTDLQDTATSNTTLEVIDFRSRLVDIKRSNDNHLRWGCEVPAQTKHAAQAVFDICAVQHVSFTKLDSTHADDGKTLFMQLHNKSSTTSKTTTCAAC